ncbi:uncharacterized protein N7503_001288 [Penicillium pulvis]|uniref:uncharacterized protein n=1 Tax=Penicillium pulvis TaxID=1562058 RepID=UPI002546A398|nr:uncharacterized protein N7503_001288 [Penicillium pulvis]KAJ5809070.1 hypothetical protein N7503_001288 [Penicillium pulvis]
MSPSTPRRFSVPCRQEVPNPAGLGATPTNERLQSPPSLTPSSSATTEAFWQLMRSTCEGETTSSANAHWPLKKVEP